MSQITLSNSNIYEFSLVCVCVQYVTAQTVSGTGSLRLAGMFLVSVLMV